MGSGEQGWPFVAGMIAVLCAICALAALLGVPAAGADFFGLAGMLLGIGAARFLSPRRDWGPAGKTVLMLAAVGRISVGSYLSVLDFSTVRGLFFWGLCLGFWPTAASGLAGPRTLGRTGPKGRP